MSSIGASLSGSLRDAARAERRDVPTNPFLPFLPLPPFLPFLPFLYFLSVYSALQ